MLEIFDAFYKQNDFFLELVLAYLPFGVLVKKRRLWGLRFAAVFAAGLLVSNFMPLYFEGAQMPLNNIYAMFRFTLLFAITLAGLKFCAEGTLWQIIFCGVCAYAVQHIFHRIKALPMYYIAWYRVDNGAASLPFFVDYLIHWAVLIPVYLIGYFLYARRLADSKDFRTDNKKLILFSLLMLITAVVISFLGYMYIYYERAMLSTPVMAVLSVFSVLVCVITLENLFSNASGKRMETELNTIQTLWKSDRKRYETVKQSMELMNIKYHDLKYMLHGVVKDEATMSEVDAVLKNYAAALQTGNETLDVVLAEKTMLCNREDIQLTFIGDGALLNGMHSVDIYSLFGNALDNAMECLRGVSNPEKKLINVAVQRDADMVRIQTENYMPGLPVLQEGLPVTTKKDKSSHGFGLKSIRYIVDKYKGQMLISTDENLFSLIISLPLVNREIKRMNAAA